MDRRLAALISMLSQAPKHLDALHLRRCGERLRHHIAILLDDRRSARPRTPGLRRRSRSPARILGDAGGIPGHLSDRTDRHSHHIGDPLAGHSRWSQQANTVTLRIRIHRPLPCEGVSASPVSTGGYGKLTDRLCPAGHNFRNLGGQNFRNGHPASVIPAASVAMTSALVLAACLRDNAGTRVRPLGPASAALRITCRWTGTWSSRRAFSWTLPGQ